LPFRYRGSRRESAVAQLFSLGHLTTTTFMKQISASIIVLAAAILIVGGAYIQHDDTKLFVMGVGCGVGLIGLWGWFAGCKDKSA
jgi:hypothetical protein